LIFEYPENYSQLPIKLKAHIQLQRYCLMINRSTGYNYDVLEAYLNRRDFENVQNKPAVNIIWGPEEILNANDIDRSLQTYNVRASAFLDWFLPGNEPHVERALIQADCEKLFGTPYNYQLPEQDDGSSPTVHNLIFSRITPYGDEQNKPACKLEMELTIWYRTQLGNPYLGG
jgi:hypothetical protein